jgi:hypothetical protein
MDLLLKKTTGGGVLAFSSFFLQELQHTQVCSPQANSFWHARADFNLLQRAFA